MATIMMAAVAAFRSGEDGSILVQEQEEHTQAHLFTNVFSYYFLSFLLLLHHLFLMFSFLL